MRAELRLINALIAMSVPMKHWPQLLLEHGFQLSALQADVVVTVDGAERTVTPEAIFQSDTERWVLLIESKSATFDDDQARRYLAVSDIDLIRRGLIVELGQPSSTVEAIYFCHSHHLAKLGPVIKWFNEREVTSLPLVDYDNHRFEKCEGVIRHIRINEVLTGGLYFQEEHWPTRFLPFDAESPEDEMRQAVLADLFSLLIDESVDRFSGEDLAERGSFPFFDRLGRGARQNLLGKMSAIVEEFRIAYLRDILDRTGSPPNWRKLDRIQRTRPSTLFGYQQDYIKRKTEGGPLPRAPQRDQLLTQEKLEEAGYEA